MSMSQVEYWLTTGCSKLSNFVTNISFMEGNYNQEDCKITMFLRIVIMNELLKKRFDY